MNQTAHFPGPIRLREWSLTLGAAIWLLAVAILHPALQDPLWARAILMLAALVLVPMGLRLISAKEVGSVSWRIASIVQLPAALLLGAANLLPQGWLAMGLSLPWLVMAGLLALHALLKLRRTPVSDQQGLCRSFSLLFLLVGAGWAFLDRMGARPLGFDPIIVLLTAIHFHYAGFALTLLVSLAIPTQRRLAMPAVWGTLLGVPLVAIGITATQLGASPAVETMAACFLAAAGMLVGLLYVALAWRPNVPWLSRCLWTLAGVSLLFSMVLAILYGLRFYWPIPWLDIPWMRAFHGTANALGFALAGLAGHWFLPNIRMASAKSSD